ncbi:MAG: nucleotide exchange factor GrpE [Bacteroidota bacterium]
MDQPKEKTPEDAVKPEETREQPEQKTETEGQNKAKPGEGEEKKTEADGQKQIAELESKVRELNDKYLRLYSEFENYRKRTAKERIELIRAAGEDVFRMVLPLIDDMERAIRANESASDLNAVKEGFQLIYNKLKTTFTSRGLEEMKTLGEDFNPDLHEAITNAPAPEEAMKGKVIEVVEKGYMLNGKVIRFAKVIVGS